MRTSSLFAAAAALVAPAVASPNPGGVAVAVPAGNSGLGTVVGVPLTSTAHAGAANPTATATATGGKNGNNGGSGNNGNTGNSASPSGSPSSGSGYKLKEDFFDNQGFFNHFNFFTGADPTNGLVEFVTEAEAQQGHLINSTSNSAWMGADSTTVLTGNAGRKAVRLTSKSTYTHMLVVVTLDKLPISCGSWPAFWTFGPNWPNEGEIDIIEGVNTQGGNQMTLHTSEGCSAAGKGDGMLNPATTSCEGNTGCGFKETSTSSWQDVNQVGGGTWAMEWTSNGISVWWWGGSNKAPASVLTDSPNPSSWGQPSMNVPNGANCNIDQKFQDHSIIFDWTFCGDWAGASGVWDASSCHSTQYPTCQSFVQNNPKAYAGVGFDVRYLKVFQQS